MLAFNLSHRKARNRLEAHNVYPSETKVVMCGLGAGVGQNNNRTGEAERSQKVLQHGGLTKGFHASDARVAISVYGGYDAVAIQLE